MGPLLGDTQVSNSEITIAVHQKVFRFDVSVDHAVVVHVLETNDAATHKEFGFLFTEMLPFVVMIPQISTSNQVGDQVQVLIVLEGIKHVDEERMIELTEQFAFVHDAVHALLLHDDALRHLFDGILSLELLALHLPNLTEASFANHTDEFKVAFVDG